MEADIASRCEQIQAAIEAAAVYMSLGFLYRGFGVDIRQVKSLISWWLSVSSDKLVVLSVAVLIVRAELFGVYLRGVDRSPFGLFGADLGAIGVFWGRRFSVDGSSLPHDIMNTRATLGMVLGPSFGKIFWSPAQVLVEDPCPRGLVPKPKLPK